MTFSHRLAQHGTAKKTAAHKLADLIPDQGCLFLDGSTTIFHVAELLAKRSGLRVVTCNLDTYLRLHRYPGVEAILTGGSQDQQTDNFIGPVARLSLRHFAFDVAFFSAFAWGPQGRPSRHSRMLN